MRDIYRIDGGARFDLTGSRPAFSSFDAEECGVFVFFTMVNGARIAIRASSEMMRRYGSIDSGRLRLLRK
jgi:hypothetical protein